MSTFCNEQLRSRVAVARALALPSYRGDFEVGSAARAYGEPASSSERALMSAVANLTSRSLKFDRLSAVARYESRAYRVGSTRSSSRTRADATR